MKREYRRAKKLISDAVNNMGGEYSSKIYAAILDNADNILGMTLKDFADITLASDATVSRFFKVRGFNTFLDAKQEIREFFLQQHTSNIRMALRYAPDISHAICTEIINQINETRMTLKEEQIDTLCKAIFNSSTIYLLGTGVTAAVTQRLQLALLSAERPVISVNLDRSEVPDSLLQEPNVLPILFEPADTTEGSVSKNVVFAKVIITNGNNKYPEDKEVIYLPQAPIELSVFSVMYLVEIIIAKIALF